VIDKLLEKIKPGAKNLPKKDTVTRGGFFMPQWQEDLGKKRKIRWYNSIKDVEGLSDADKEKYREVSEAYGFRSNSYYLSLINWDDPKDPIRRLVIPDPVELDDKTSQLDASLEHLITVAPGCEHKYSTTALILVSRVCGSLCRFCFRKRIFMKENSEISPDLEPAFEYIRNHKEVTNVLLTGGDPFVLSTRKIQSMLETLRAIPHVNIIRFGSKLLAFNPFRFIDDPELLDLLEKYSLPEKRIYIVSHFNHPREITDESIKAIDMMQKRGLMFVNQTPVLAGINDDPDTMGELFGKLARIGVQPYYIFQCRPTRGNAHFKTTIIRSIDVMEGAKRRVSGLGKRGRFTGSHASGKIEIISYDDDYIYFKYHQSKDPRYYGQAFRLPRKDDATWWDDWMPGDETFTLDTCPDAELMSGTQWI